MVGGRPQELVIKDVAAVGQALNTELSIVLERFNDQTDIGSLFPGVDDVGYLRVHHAMLLLPFNDAMSREVNILMISHEPYLRTGRPSRP